MIVTKKFNSREDWLESRTAGIGASDIATIVGLNPYETPYSLWRRKLGLDPAKEETLPMKLGHLMEDTVATLYADETGATIDSDSVGDFIVYDDEAQHLRVSPDRYATRVDGTREVVEIKTTQMAIDPDNLPEWWFCQLQMNMGVTGIHEGTLAWLSSGRTFGYQHIKLVPEFYDFLRESAERFWRENIQGRQEPKPINSDDILAKYGIGTKGKEVEANTSTYQACQRLKMLKDQIAELEAGKTRLEEEIKLALSDATELTFHGELLATWRGSNGVSSFDRKAFERDHPEMAKRYIIEKPGTRRFLLK